MAKQGGNVLFYGGLKGDDANDKIFIYNAMSSNWTTLDMNVSLAFKSYSLYFVAATMRGSAKR